MEYDIYEAVNISKKAYVTRRPLHEARYEN